MSIKNKHREKNEHKILDMELGHLVEDSEKWWDSTGSELLRNRTFSGSMKQQQASLNATNPVHPNYIGGKSGIMMGVKWSMLTPQERYKVVHAYTLTLSGHTMVIGE